MRYLKDGIAIEAAGGWEALERLGFRSELSIEYENKRKAERAVFQERLKEKWTCPDCGKTVPAMYQKSHHAKHSETNRVDRYQRYKAARRTA